MLSIDRTNECREIFAKRYPNRGMHVLPFLGVRWLVIHKTSLSQLGPDNPRPVPDAVLDGPTLADRFAESPGAPPAGLGTAGRIPYHFLIRGDADATLEQILPLTVAGAHARAYNDRSWAVAWVGDSDVQAPPDAAYRRIVLLASALIIANGGLYVAGHTEIPGASGDPNKRCPGRYLIPAQVASDAAKLLPWDWQEWSNDRVRAAIQAAGLVL